MAPNRTPDVMPTKAQRCALAGSGVRARSIATVWRGHKLRAKRLLEIVTGREEPLATDDGTRGRSGRFFPRCGLIGRQRNGRKEHGPPGDNSGGRLSSGASTSPPPSREEREPAYPALRHPGRNPDGQHEIIVIALAPRLERLIPRRRHLHPKRRQLLRQRLRFA